MAAPYKLRTKEDPKLQKALNVPQKVPGLGIVTWQRQLRTRQGCAPNIEVSHDGPGTSPIKQTRGAGALSYS